MRIATISSAGSNCRPAGDPPCMFTSVDLACTALHTHDRAPQTARLSVLLAHNPCLQGQRCIHGWHPFQPAGAPPPASPPPPGSSPVNSCQAWVCAPLGRWCCRKSHRNLLIGVKGGQPDTAGSEPVVSRAWGGQTLNPVHCPGWMPPSGLGTCKHTAAVQQQASPIRNR